MLKLDVNRLLRMRGIKFGAVWLSKRGMTYKQAVLLTSGKAKTLRVSTIQKLCNAFDCTPNELFAYQPKGDKLSPSLAPLIRDSVVQSPQEILENLSQTEVERLMKQLEEMKKGT